jgi:hypothetical protein
MTSLPSRATIPDAVQMTRHNPTDSVYFKTPSGEMNIPEPRRKIEREKDSYRIEKKCNILTNDTGNNKASS